MNERIKEIRELLNLNQEDFGNRIGVKKAAISKIEKGANKLTDQMIKAICREFRVNPEWLTEAIGEPFLGAPDSLIEKVAEEYNLNTFEKNLMEEYLNLTHEERSVFEKFFKNIFQKDSVNKQSTAENRHLEVAEELSPFADEPKLTKEDEREIELIKQGMLAEKKGKTSSASISVKDA